MTWFSEARQQGDHDESNPLQSNDVALGQSHQNLIQNTQACYHWREPSEGKREYNKNTHDWEINLKPDPTSRHQIITWLRRITQLKNCNIMVEKDHNRTFIY